MQAERRVLCVAERSLDRYQVAPRCRRANGLAVQPRTALSCAAARRNASRETSRGSGGPNERPCVGCDRELARPFTYLRADLHELSFIQRCMLGWVVEVTERAERRSSSRPK